jgi:hypothetical protein
MYVENPKRQVLWNGGSNSQNIIEVYAKTETRHVTIVSWYPKVKLRKEHLIGAQITSSII